MSGWKITPRLCHNNQEIKNKRLTVDVSLQSQGVKMLRNLNAKFPLVNTGDNAYILITHRDRGRDEPRSVLAVVMNVEDFF